jgi:cytochrome o ubiquinol oxidase subunit 2
MKKTFKTIFLVLICLAVVGLSALYISRLYIPVMDPSGMIGHKERHLISTASHLMLIILIPLYLMTWFIAWRYKDTGKGKHTPDWEHNYIAEYCWWGVPLIIVIILSALIWKSSHELNPFKPLEGKKGVTIQVVALNWKWLFIYPEQGIATVNFVQFPEKTPINFEITADAPMNAFWIPALGGQIYAMPAMKSQLHLIADKPGQFKGLSANFSGRGFAGMTFIAEAIGEAEFDGWMQKGKGSGGTLDIKEYERLVLNSENEPIAFYTLGESNLFQYILDKYNVPKKAE